MSHETKLRVKHPVVVLVMMELVVQLDGMEPALMVVVVKWQRDGSEDGKDDGEQMRVGRIM